MPPANQPIRLAQYMVLVAIAAGSLALLVSLPWEARLVPTFWVFLGVIDFVAAWKLVFRRPLRASHYVFLITFVIGSIVLMVQVGMERFRPLAFALRVSPRDMSLRLGDVFVHDLWEFWAATSLALLLAWGFGYVAGRLEGRRGWDIAAVCRGMLLGFALASLFGTIQRATLGPGKDSIVANWVALAAAVPFCGWLGWSRLSSTHLERHGHPGPIIEPSAAPGLRSPASARPPS